MDVLHDGTKQAAKALPQIRTLADCAGSNRASGWEACSSQSPTRCSCHLKQSAPCLTSRCVP